jgi:hypothetical protein
MDTDITWTLTIGGWYRQRLVSLIESERAPLAHTPSHCVFTTTTWSGLLCVGTHSVHRNDAACNAHLLRNRPHHAMCKPTLYD